MPFIPAAPGVWRIKLFWDLAGASALNVLYVFNTDAGANDIGTAAGYTALTEAAIQEFGPDGNSIIDMTSNGAKVVKITAEDASVQDGVLHERATFQPGGTETGALPPGVAWVSKWGTNLRGRSNHGRTFWPGLPEQSVGENGEINTAQRLELDDALEGFWSKMNDTAINAANAGLHVVSYFHQVVPGTPPTVARDVAVHHKIQSHFVDVHVHSQRRRNLPG